MMHLQVVGDQFRAVSTRLYDIFLLDKDGKVQAVVAAGVDSITTANPCPDISSAKKIFPHIKPSALQRPCGQVELLIGACDGRLLPFGGLRVGDLRLENTPWREGQVLRGSHPDIPLCSSPLLSPEATAASQAFLNLPAGGREFPGLQSFSSNNTAMLPVLVQDDI